MQTQTTAPTPAALPGGGLDEPGLRAEVEAVLSAAPLATVRSERDPRPLHRALGRWGLLAPQWPERFGGRGTSHVAAAVLIEELARHDVPDLLHTLTIQIVGNALLACGSEEDCARYLPGFASGRLFACVLFSEPDAGSDLAALSTRAVAEGRGYRIFGTKTHSIFAAKADVGLCLARTGDGQDLSMFVVPLHSPGVTITPVPTLMEDDFHEVALDGVFVEESALVGGRGQGWSRLVQTLVYERTGLDYYAKALHWYERARSMPGAAASTDPVAAGRLAAELAAAGALVRRVLTRLDAGTLTEAEAAVSKWYTSELAARVAWWAAEGCADRALLAAVDAEAGDVPGTLAVALADAAAQRISGGTSEMMLETVARLRLDPGAKVRP